jgi:hypothetical protein
MRNDARPVGHEQSPVPAHRLSEDDGQSSVDGRESSVESHAPSVTHGSQSHGINRGADDNARPDDTDVDPVMPGNDSSLTTKI